MKPIRASDIGSYLYCRRAWWYRIRGFESGNQAEMAAGTELHRRHGRAVLRSGVINLLAWVILLAAVVLLAYFGTTWLIGGLL